MADNEEFVKTAERYWQSEGWRTEQNRISDAVYVIAGIQGGDEYGMLFVVPDPETEVSEEIVSKADKIAESKESVAAITARGEYTNPARHSAERAGIEIVPVEVLEAESPSFDDEITMPDSGDLDEDDSTNSRFNGDKETLEIRQANRLWNRTKRTKHYNTNNIAFLQSINISTTLLGKLSLYGLPTVAAGTVLSQFRRPLIAIAIFMSLFLPQWYFMYSRDRAVIGTFSSNDRIESDEIDTLESLFKQSASNIITIVGSKKRFPWDIDYKYHLVPENVVSVQRGSRVRGILYYLLVFVILFALLSAREVIYIPIVSYFPDPQSTVLIQAVVLTLVAYLFEKGHIPFRLGNGMGMKTVQYSILAFVVTFLTSLATTYGGLYRFPAYFEFSFPHYILSFVVLSLVTGLVLSVLLRGKRNAIVVQLQGGDDKLFLMADDDADRVLSEFKQR